MKYLKLLGLSLVLIASLMSLPAVAGEPGPVVVMETNMGTLFIQLDEEKAPISVQNFLAYVDDKHYDGTIFHRVIKTFMIQGGGFDANMRQKPTRSPIKNEATNGLSNDKGTIAMARTNVVDSATTQFFINTVDNGFLNHKGMSNYGYAVFGKVIRGMNVVDEIAKVKTGIVRGMRDVPVEPVVIERVYRYTE